VKVAAGPPKGSPKSCVGSPAASARGSELVVPAPALALALDPAAPQYTCAFNPQAHRRHRRPERRSSARRAIQSG
jgi:hypothetical protein